METLKISKAEQKRRQDATNYINAALRRKLKDFENDYIDSAAKWSIRKLELDIEGFESDIKSLDLSRKDYKWRKEQLENQIQRVRKALTYDAILKMEAMVAAKQNYDSKINDVVALLVKEGFDHRFRVEDIGMGSVLEFLITNTVKEVHARVIFVNGPIKAPHFRFITTVRQK